MRLIVGLGNPGEQYEWTPHNAGFLALDAIAERAGIRATRQEAKSLAGKGEFAGERVILAKPQTLMNLSGVSVRMWLERCEDCDAAETIVLSDDVALPWGMLRIRKAGSAGGHNGLKSIIAAIGSEFIRVRLGVGPEKIWGDMADYVLTPARRAERDVMLQMAVGAADAVETILREGVDKAMGKYNRRVPPAEEEETQ
ncbi:MAG TPA: aminoacyl-tRNA hydrolase [Candidatus Acidoferrum sp.]|nr:aminoacyl-tRNA hydrolase [Candidatus Acidoferrum sp.]